MGNVEVKPKRILTKSDFEYDWDVVGNEWILLKDGTRLSSRIWMPKTDTPVPAILEYIPYRKQDGTRTRDEPMHGYFAGNGYVAIRVDMRGTGESDGLCMDEYLLQEQDDALEVIDWISKQPWCDGNVGMMGKSWGGFNSLQVAARRPPALRAIICVGFTDDRFNQDIHYKGGCLLNDNFWWGNIMLAYQSRGVDSDIKPDSWKKETVTRLESMPLWMQNWMEHQTRDAYWKHGSVCENYSAIQVPVFAIDGWSDSYTNTVLTLLNGLDVPRKGIIGPWAHVYAHDGYPAPAMDFLGEATKWWDKWLKGIDNDTLDCPLVQLWLEDSMKPGTIHPVSNGRWVGLDSWPSTDVTEREYYLTSGSLLDMVNSRKETLELCTPLNHGILANEWMGAGVEGENPADQRIDDGMAAVFDSRILERETEIVGYPVFEVELISDKPVSMLFAQLSDIHPDGSSTRVSWGVMNLTHLQGHDKVVPLTPGEPVMVTVTLDVCGHNFPSGHRIRLSIANSFWPMFWPSPELATLTLDLSTARLRLPVFVGKDCKGPSMDAKCAPLTPVTILSEGNVDRYVTYDLVTDTWTTVTNGVGGVFGEGIYRFDDIGTVVEHNLKRELVLSNKDPLTAKYTITQKMKNGRDGWLTDTDIVMTQTAGKDYFYLTGRMETKINGEPVFHRDYDEKIKRNGI
ncbi:CocE/NonD family hydrolase [Salmonella enterica subsp. enterica]|nr:CocE/NonD family hydrolase [Salmonella enterica subsp. enterica]EDY2803480.1 CocE/NonD family hydrolase [Salmonella enterica subsp. enterica]